MATEDAHQPGSISVHQLDCMCIAHIVQIRPLILLL